MNYKAKCINDVQEKNGLMFILNNEYSVRKYHGNAFHEYVVVNGKFTNSNKEIFQAERILYKKTCETYLKIL